MQVCFLFDISDLNADLEDDLLNKVEDIVLDLDYDYSLYDFTNDGFDLILTMWNINESQMYDLISEFDKYDLEHELKK